MQLYRWLVLRNLYSDKEELICIGAGLLTVMYGNLAETAIFNSILGGKVTLAQTGKYDALLSGINGTLLAPKATNYKIVL